MSDDKSPKPIIIVTRPHDWAEPARSILFSQRQQEATRRVSVSK